MQKNATFDAALYTNSFAYLNASTPTRHQSTLSPPTSVPPALHIPTSHPPATDSYQSQSPASRCQSSRFNCQEVLSTASTSVSHPYLVLFLVSSLRLCGFCFPLCLVLAARFCFPIPRLVLRPSRPGAGPLSPRLIPRIRPDPLFPGCVRTLAFLFGLLHRFLCDPSSLHLAVRLV